MTERAPVPPSDTTSAGTAATDPGAARAERGEALGDRTEQRLRLLDELAEKGMALTRALWTKAMAAVTPETAASPAADSETAAATEAGIGELVLAYSRAARAVRQAVALQARIERDQREAVVAADEARKLRRKTMIKRAVARVVTRNVRYPTELYRAQEELSGRVEDLDDDEIGDRPMGEIVARICGLLGVAFDRGPWEEHEASAGPGTPSSPPHETRSGRAWAAGSRAAMPPRGTARTLSRATAARKRPDSS